MKTLFERNTRKPVILSLALMAAMMVVGIAVAQVPKYAPVQLFSYVGTVTNLAGSAATNVNVVIDCANQASVAVEITHAAKTNGAVAAGNLLFYFQRSVSGVSYDFPSGTMNGSTIVTVPISGATPKTITTNLPTQGCGYMRLAWVTNSDAAGIDITNLSVTYGVKVSSP